LKKRARNRNIGGDCGGGGEEVVPTAKGPFGWGSETRDEGENAGLWKVPEGPAWEGTKSFEENRASDE